MKKGFTLIEILIVVAIIAILASVVIVGLGPTQQAGRDARRLADLHTAQNAFALYYNKCGFYPGGAPNAAGAACTAGTPAAAAWAGGAASVYGAVATEIVGSSLNINTMPQDPRSGATYKYATNAASSPTSYIVEATLESGNNAAFNGYGAPSSSAYTSGDGQSGFPGCASPNYCLTL